MKKWIALLLIAATVLVALPGSAFADTAQEGRIQQIAEDAEAVYKKCRSTAGMKSFAGYCGLMTSHQLYNMGINTELIVKDGNKQYDYYKDLEETSGGYYIKPYSAADYTLAEALNTISRGGKKDVFNLLVGFQWTSTEAGARYGHAVIINAIIDGTVYFVESFNYCFESLSCKEGKLLSSSIADFAKYFDSWCRFEGIIYFGEKQFAAGCQLYGTDVFLRARFHSQVRSQPCLVGENNCQRLRSVEAGEILHATAVCKNAQGELFYRVQEGQDIGYISANAVSLLELNPESLLLQDGDIPTQLKVGQKLKLQGTVLGGYANVTEMGLRVKTADGQTVYDAALDNEGVCAKLELLNDSVCVEDLEEGSYLLEIYATASHVLVQKTGFINQYFSATVLTQPLTIGDGEAIDLPEAEQQPKEGWIYENGSFHCYENGQPATGWQTRFGVDYYLQENGAVTTGWQEEDGWYRYFSATGALCIGWVTTEDGLLYYWLSDGVYATGWQEIDGKWYLFDENGIFLTEDDGK